MASDSEGDSRYDLDGSQQVEVCLSVYTYILLYVASYT